MNYVIFDLDNMSIVRFFSKEDEAKQMLYELRKQRYIDEHPDRPEWEYDTMKHDNGYNLYKCKLVA